MKPIENGSYGSSAAQSGVGAFSRRILASCKTLAKLPEAWQGLLTHIFDGFYESCDRRPPAGPVIQVWIPFDKIATRAAARGAPRCCRNMRRRVLIRVLAVCLSVAADRSAWAAFAPRGRAAPRRAAAATGEKPSRSVRWTARSEVATPCDDRMRQYLRQMDAELIVRLDDSVEAVTPLGGDRYEAAITSVGFFGLLSCRPLATLRVERTGAGIRYVMDSA